MLGHVPKANWAQPSKSDACFSDQVGSLLCGTVGPLLARLSEPSCWDVAYAHRVLLGSSCEALHASGARHPVGRSVND